MKYILYRVLKGVANDKLKSVSDLLSDPQARRDGDRLISAIFDAITPEPEDDRAEIYPIQKEIEQARFQEICLAQTTLANACAIEECFDVLVENYYNFESNLLSLALQFLLFPQWKDSSLNQSRIRINIYLLNFFNAFKLYIDQVQKKYVKSVSDSMKDYPEDARNLKQYLSVLKNNEAIRLVVELRNFAQHQELFATVSYRWDISSPTGQIAYRATATADIDTIILKRKRNTAVVGILDRIKGANPKAEPQTDLRPVIRIAMHHVFRLHSDIRRCLTSCLNRAENVILDTFQEIQNEFRGWHDGKWAVAKVNDQGKLLDSLPIFREIITRRKSLVEKNPCWQKISSSYVTNELREDGLSLLRTLELLHDENEGTGIGS
jgi:hypothetical protein